MLKHSFSLLFLFILVIVLASCDLSGDIKAILDKLTSIEEGQTAIKDDLAAEFTDLDVTVAFADTQYDQTGPDWYFDMIFPTAADITILRAADANILIASYGPTLGGTIVTVNVQTNAVFYVTGTRIENVRYRTDVSNVYIDYSHPVYGDYCPVFSTVPTSQSYTGSVAAIPVSPGVDNVFEVGLSTELSLWDHIDYDGDGAGNYFAEDQDEVISLQGSLFFEGYLADGTEFSGNFPAPLHLEMTIYHDVP